MQNPMLPSPPDHNATLGRLHALSRNHLLFFRLEVGRLLLQDYFGGDPAAYHSQDPNKIQSFNGFLQNCSEQLREIGLGESVLRSCIHAHVAVAALPPGTVERLLFSHIVELARVEDGATRGLLAQATIKNHWSSRQLRDAAHAARAGLWIDAETTPVTPPAPPEEQPKTPQLGRVVSRFERSADDVEALGNQWRQIAGKKLTSGQKNRIREALLRVKAQLSEVEAALGADGG